MKAFKVAGFAYLIILIGCAGLALAYVSQGASASADVKSKIILPASARILIAARQPYRFSVDGCEFAVSFPNEPKIEQVSAGDFTMPEAELFAGESLLRANCLPFQNLFASDAKLLKTTVLSYLEKNGFSNGDVRVSSTKFGLVAKGRGYKKIQDIWATTEIFWYATDNSVLTILVGSRSEIYPTREISDFLKSVETP